MELSSLTKSMLRRYDHIKTILNWTNIHSKRFPSVLSITYTHAVNVISRSFGRLGCNNLYRNPPSKRRSKEGIFDRSLGPKIKDGGMIRFSRPTVDSRSLYVWERFKKTKERIWSTSSNKERRAVFVLRINRLSIAPWALVNRISTAGRAHDPVYVKYDTFVVSKRHARRLF